MSMYFLYTAHFTQNPAKLTMSKQIAVRLNHGQKKFVDSKPRDADSSVMLHSSLISTWGLVLGGFTGFCPERMVGGFEEGAGRIRTDVIVLSFHSSDSRYVGRQGVTMMAPSGLVSTSTVVEFALLLRSGAGHILALLVVGASHR